MVKMPAELAMVEVVVDVRSRVPDAPRLIFIWLSVSLSIDSPLAQVRLAPAVARLKISALTSTVPSVLLSKPSALPKVKSLPEISMSPAISRRAAVKVA